jgi:hypothetical protein
MLAPAADTEGSSEAAGDAEDGAADIQGKFDDLVEHSLTKSTLARISESQSLYGAVHIWVKLTTLE